MADVILPPKPRSRHHANVARLNTAPPESSKAKSSQAHGMDKILLYTTIALSILGITAVFSASATEALDVYGNSLYFVQRQAVFLALGFALMLGVAKVPFFYWSRWARPLALCVLGLLLYTLQSGVEAYGAERWIRIFGIQFQPSELGKLSVVLLLAQILGLSGGPKRNLMFLFNLGLVFATLLLIYKQPSLSMTVILSLVTAGMMFVAGIPAWILAVGGGLGGCFVITKLLHTQYQLRRIQGWLNPWKDPQDTGYNLIQSLYAIGSGGLVGTGVGMSHQKLYYLPFQYTDFIFSVWAEEWGLVGCLVLIGLFLTLLYRGYIIAKTCHSHFGQMLAMGITLVLTLQILINFCVATGLFPVTGVTLPLISYGGTSVIVTLLMIGLLLNISQYRTDLSPVPKHKAPA